MRHWFKSEMFPNTQLFVELNEHTAADGMPRMDPELLGFVQGARGAIARACVFGSTPREVQISETCNLWQAKTAVEKALKL